MLPWRHYAALERRQRNMYEAFHSLLAKFLLSTSDRRIDFKKENKISLLWSKKHSV